MEKVPEIYDAAVKKKPKNDELLSHLFMVYVRTEDYKKQQQTVLALHKVVSSNPYYSWAVMSIVMQVLLMLYMYVAGFVIGVICIQFLNQTCAGHRPLPTWFLEIDPVHDVCVYVCVRP